jgi:hypothetical protein
MATPSDFLVALSRAYVSTAPDPGRETELAEALASCRGVHGDLGWLVVRLGEEGFLAGGEELPAREGDLSALFAALTDAGVVEVRFQEAVPPETLEDFLRRLRPDSGLEGASGSARFRGLEGAIGLSFRGGGGPPVGMAGMVHQLFSDAKDASEQGDLPLGLSETEEPEAFHSPLPPDLEETVRSFFSAKGQEKARLGEALAAAAARLQESRAQGTVADLVEELAQTTRSAPPDPEALELATRLTTTPVASQLVGRLGSTRNDVEKERLIRLSSGLGREMALALADALGEARDRYQRRNFMDALLAQGQAASEMAQRMIQDPRWYVVRNGVALLGDLGGEDVVSHLTIALGNGDPRVRRETVRALSKVGGEDAALLLMGMLDDPAADVRARVCRALGLLRVERAVRPILALLEKDGDEEVQVESIQALGKLGDPGAVPLIERKMSGRFFSRPSKAVRLAAFRALASIGTPHAKNLLKKATNDSDPDVRRLALGLTD